MALPGKRYRKNSGENASFLRILFAVFWRDKNKGGYGLKIKRFKSNEQIASKMTKKDCDLYKINSLHYLCGIV